MNLPQRIRECRYKRELRKIQDDIDSLNKYESRANQPCFDTYLKVAHLEQQLARMKGRGE